MNVFAEETHHERAKRAAALSEHCHRSLSLCRRDRRPDEQPLLAVRHPHHDGPRHLARPVFHGDHGPLYRVRLLQSVYGPALSAFRLPAADGPAGPARRRVLRGLRHGTQCRPAVSRRADLRRRRIFYQYGGPVPDARQLVPEPPGRGDRHRHGGQRRRRFGFEPGALGHYGIGRLAHVAAVCGGECFLQPRLRAGGSDRPYRRASRRIPRWDDRSCPERNF